MSATDSALLQQPFSHVINGKSFDAKGAKRMPVVNPATEKPIAEVPVCDRATLDLAVEAGQAAFGKWRHTTWAERAAAMRAWGKDFEALVPELAKLLVAEQGKSLQMAQMECQQVVDYFNNMPGMELKDEVVHETETHRVVQSQVPLGVTVGIVPWNFPILLMTWKIIPAVLTGNTIIIKPSPFTPLCDIRIVESAQKHFPPGVVQIVVGDDSLGPWTTEHPGVRKVSFTGSSATGRLVARSCSATLKRLTLELGGNDPCIVLPDADVETMAPQVLFATMFNSGQTCVCAKRVYVHEDIYDRFSAAMAQAAGGMKVGNGAEEGITFGPINNKMQFDKVSGFFDDSQQRGHKFLTGGKIDKGAKGYFAPLTLVDNPPEGDRIVREEPFGPIVPLLKWKDEEDVIKRANDSEYGLGAMVWGTDKARLERIARRIESGVVWCNSLQAFSPFAPFGGAKSSGVGCESGREGLKGWTQTTALWLPK